MIDLFSDICIQIVLDVLLNYPGASIRWALLRGRQPISKLKDDFELNSFIAIIFIALVTGIVAVIRQY